MLLATPLLPRLDPLPRALPTTVTASCSFPNSLKKNDGAMRAKLPTDHLRQWGAMIDGPMNRLRVACVGCQSLVLAHAGRATHPCTYGVFQITSTLEMQMEDSDTCDAATFTMYPSTLDFAVHIGAIRARRAWEVIAVCTDTALG